MCTAPVKYDPNWITTRSNHKSQNDVAVIVTRAQLEVKKHGSKSVLHLRLRFTKVSDHYIVQNNWVHGPTGTSQKSGILMKRKLLGIELDLMQRISKTNVSFVTFGSLYRKSKLSSLLAKEEAKVKQMRKSYGLDTPYGHLLDSSKEPPSAPVVAAAGTGSIADDADGTDSIVADADEGFIVVVVDAAKGSIVAVADATGLTIAG
ncbi:unnamed protein product [Arabidopsis lyrata]|nr:unnamed protein product [Arabidopsis lyrata]